MANAVDGAHRIATIDLDRTRVAADLARIDEGDLQPCAGYAVGRWSLGILWTRDATPNATPPLGERLGYVVHRLRETFRFEMVEAVLLFAAAPRSFLRPHRDWIDGTDHATRIHIPLATDAHALSAEDDALYHMDVGEIWYVDAARLHTGGTLSPTQTRFHACVDLRPGVAIADAFRDPTAYRPPHARKDLPRAAFTPADRRAILGLAELVTVANLPMVVDLLGALHFERNVDCGEVYEWLREIARRSGDPHLAAEVATLCARFLLTPLESELELVRGP